MDYWPKEFPRVVLKPDRRRIADRRGVFRGGRRPTDNSRMVPSGGGTWNESERQEQREGEHDDKSIAEACVR